jgi:acetylornithine deacetylase
MDVQASQDIVDRVEANRDAIVQSLQELIRIPSVTGQEGEIQRFLAHALGESDLDVDVFEPDVEILRREQGFVEPEIPFTGRPNVVGIWRGSGGGRSLVLNGHVDTVPVGPDEKCGEGPYSGSVSDGRVWGRGASDMKSGLAAMTMAIRVLREMGYRPGGDVILQFVVDEERTGLGTLSCVQRGYVADGGICCETSDLQVMPACIGRLWFTVSLSGKPAGIAARWEGVSAIEKGLRIVQAVEDLERMRIEDLTHPLYPDNRGALPCAVTMFQAGTFPSITPEKAVLRGSMGLMPYEDLDAAETQLRRHIEAMAGTDPWLRHHPPVVTCEGGYRAAGAEIPTGHPIVGVLQSAFQQVTGGSARLAGRMGAADSRFLIRNGKTPTAIFGPGETAQMHATNESVPVENLIVATKVLALSVVAWCTNGDDPQRGG